MARIIIIDDEVDIQDVLQEVLTRAGYEVQVAGSGQVGLDLLREKQADLVIADIIMPGKDGVETVNEIRTEFPDTKIIAISGGGNVTPMDYEPAAIKTSAYLASASAAGADITLTKPFGREELVGAVKELISAC